MTQVDWKPWPKEKPKGIGHYLITYIDKWYENKKYVCEQFYLDEKSWMFGERLECIAWAEKPEPYQPCETAKVTTALAHTAQRFSKNTKMFDLLNEKGIPALPILERAIIDLAIYFEIDDVKEFRKRFYHLFYPEWAEFALDCNLVEFPNFMGVKQ